MSATRSTSRAIASTMLAMALITTVASATTGENPQPSKSQPENLKPIFLVKALADFAQNGIPTPATPERDQLNLDLADLANSLAAQLSAWGVGNVVTANNPRAANMSSAPAVYILELTVESVYSVERERWNDTSGHFDHCRVIGAELALSVSHVLTGPVIGLTAERSEYYFPSDAEAREVEARRGAVYAVAERLSDRFVEAWAAGRFEPSLPASQAPTLFERLPHTLEINGLTIPALMVVLGLSFLFVGLMSGVAYRRRIRAIDEEWSRLTRAQAEADHAQVDQTVKNALALALKTDNFSNPACRDVAAAKRDAILAAHAEIVAKEAERRLDAKSRAAHYERVAARASARSELDHVAIVDILRQAEEWEFRVLQAAKKLAVEAAK